MTKLTIVAIFLVFFLGMMAKETQGQHICHQILLDNNCDGATCTDLCDKKLQGTGQCYRTVDRRFICLCNYICRT
ncbi:low-molecular-weight cysteine-rich 8 [Arabidopsis lyrata subsp. lyrata]|uniref:Low-molecular-weight cysteine-rich 8 n=2 Tax=Arabidopsis lyrata subsp. lyrata TaxID=81972 RepID=D7LS66_ARALL|nr:low-molecular-weight cysteine-rich 8 [Arabidopsis lyrata subsp. lyrata]